MKRHVLLALFLCFIASTSFAQQLTTVGVIDTARIYTTYFSQSAAVRELESLRNQFQEDLMLHSQELRDLQAQKVDAESRGDDFAALQLDELVYQKVQFIREFQRIRQRQLEDMQNNLLQSDEFLQELQTAIRLVSETAGFTVILDARDPAIQWWSLEVDITDRVIERLRLR